jgi:hypothetical protein
MIELIKVVNAEALGGYRIRISFSNGDAGIRDFADVVKDGGPMIEPLRAPAFFARVFIQSGVLAWPNGLDLDAISLHQEMSDAGLLKRASAVS